jgi:hypothetical protein
LADKRYSVFISSTFEDLKEERQAVQDSVIRSGDFPVQMETFPAADEDQFAFIRSLIDKCDYYVLIVAGRYGSTDDDGISYTEKEYRYAITRDIPVLALVHGDRGSIQAGKSEASQEGKVRLAAFISDIEKNRLRKTWTSCEQLKLAVREALDHAKATKPAVGWVRGDTIASVKILEELNEVRKENVKYLEAVGSFDINLSLPPIPSSDDTIYVNIIGIAKKIDNRIIYGSNAKIETTWISMFPLFYENITYNINNYNGELSYLIYSDDSAVQIGSAIANQVAVIDASECFKITKAMFNRLSAYYIEVGLMLPSGSEDVFTEAAKKLARRHSILSSSINNFKIAEGEVEVVSTVKQDFGADSEIPF